MPFHVSLQYMRSWTEKVVAADHELSAQDIRCDSECQNAEFWHSGFWILDYACGTL